MAEKIPRQNGVQAVELLPLIAPIKVDSEETVCRAERHDSIKCGKKRSGSEFKVVDKKSADKLEIRAMKEEAYILHLGKRKANPRVKLHP